VLALNDLICARFSFAGVYDLGPTLSVTIAVAGQDWRTLVPGNKAVKRASP
jgi:hypothetical protein